MAQCSSSAKNDKISVLPDELLSRILSLISTKDAVRTSILSKRWRFIWTWTNSLDFDDDEFCGYLNFKERFIEFINSVLYLFLNPPHSSIHKFHLRSNVLRDELKINYWLWAALKEPNFIKEVNLSIRATNPVALPKSLYTCNTLEFLRLNGSSIDFNVNSCVSFPNLKSLYLENVNLGYVPPAPGSGSVYFPKVEKLHIHQVKCIDTSSVGSIRRLICSCPILKHLIVLRSGEDENIDNLTNAYAPALQILEIYDIIPGFIINLLGGLSSVKFLSLRYITFDCIARQLQYLPPTFCNLKRLDIDISCLERNALFILLAKIGNLEHLACKTGLGLCDLEFGKRACCCNPWVEPEHVPKCMLGRLKAVLISFFRGCNGEFEVVKYILKNAMVLEKFILLRDKYRRNEEAWGMSELDLFDKITSFPRGSSYHAHVVVADE